MDDYRWSCDCRWWHMTAAPKSSSPCVEPSMAEGELLLQLLTVARESHYHLAPSLPLVHSPSCSSAGSAPLARTTMSCLSLDTVVPPPCGAFNGRGGALRLLTTDRGSASPGRSRTGRRRGTEGGAGRRMKGHRRLAVDLLVVHCSCPSITQAQCEGGGDLVGRREEHRSGSRCGRRERHQLSEERRRRRERRARERRK